MAMTTEEMTKAVNEVFPEGAEQFKGALTMLMTWSKLRMLEAKRDALRIEQQTTTQQYEAGIQQVEQLIDEASAEIRETVK